MNKEYISENIFFKDVFLWPLLFVIDTCTISEFTWDLVMYCISADKRNVPRKCICQFTADRKDTIMNKLKPVPQV